MVHLAWRVIIDGQCFVVVTATIDEDVVYLLLALGLLGCRIAGRVMLRVSWCVPQVIEVLGNEGSTDVFVFGRAARVGLHGFEVL